MPAMSFFRRQWAAKSAVITKARQVRKRTGKSVLSQLQEITRLRMGVGRLSPTDYFAYSVYDDQLYTSQGKRQVLSWDPDRVARALNDPKWRALCGDKLVFYGFLQGMGLPFPEVYAAYDARPRSCGAVPALATVQALKSFLHEGMRYPFFAKPIGGTYGSGVSFVRQIDRGRDSLLFMTGEEIRVDEYIREYVIPARGGYLFQKPIVQHPSIDRLSGGRAATLRMIVLNGDDGPKLFRVIWRIPVGSNITDNFMGGRQGNLIAHVDLESGEVGKVIQAIGFEGDLTGNQGYWPMDVESHPDTGERIRGVTLPGWDGLVSLCLVAAAAFPGVRFQSWDIAIGPDGPLILELNYRGGIRVIQVPGFGGLFDQEFQEFWACYADEQRVSQ